MPTVDFFVFAASLTRELGVSPEGTLGSISGSEAGSLPLGRCTQQSGEPVGRSRPVTTVKPGYKLLIPRQGKEHVQGPGHLDWLGVG